MKKLLITILLFSTINVCSGQLDKNGNPIFNSIKLKTQQLEDYSLSIHYYTIANNIDNPKSSVFVSEKPTKEEYLKFSRDLPSYAFIIHKDEKVMKMFTLIQTNENSSTILKYKVFDPSTEKTEEFDCGAWGEIAEIRVKELQEINIDPNSKVIDLPNNGKGFIFNGIAYRIQFLNTLLEEVHKFADYLMKPDNK